MKALEKRVRAIESKQAISNKSSMKTLVPEWLLDGWEDELDVPHQASTPEWKRVTACLSLAGSPGIYARAAR